ncbi:MAG: putative amidohydrolase [Candidatus Latescibacterota bacterium]|jgi:predicted amidohydrolase
MARITIACIQPPCLDEASPEAQEHMLQAGFALLEEALSKDTAFCCLPEFFNVFGSRQETYCALAANHAEVLERASVLASTYQSYIVLPMLVPENDHFYNRAYLIAPDGALKGHYDKVHPTLAEREMLGVVGGNSIDVFDTEYGRVALPICYDLYFPEFFAALALRQPDILFFPSLQRSDHEPASETLLKARAMDTKSYIARASYGCRTNLPWKAGQMFGQSAIVHPDGTLLASAGHYEGIALAHIEVPFSWQRQRCGGYAAEPVRQFLAEDRRPDIYAQEP